MNNYNKRMAEEKEHQEKEIKKFMKDYKKTEDENKKKKPEVPIRVSVSQGASNSKEQCNIDSSMQVCYNVLIEVKKVEEKVGAMKLEWNKIKEKKCSYEEYIHSD